MNGTLLPYCIHSPANLCCCTSMISNAISVLTTAAMLLHAAFGCCWHHHHESSATGSMVAVESERASEDSAHQCCCHSHGEPTKNEAPVAPSEPCDQEQCPEIGVSVATSSWSQWLNPHFAASPAEALVSTELLSGAEHPLVPDNCTAGVCLLKLQVCLT